jgi:hypothetical protein
LLNRIIGGGCAVLVEHHPRDLLNVIVHYRATWPIKPWFRQRSRYSSQCQSSAATAPPGVAGREEHVRCAHFSDHLLTCPREQVRGSGEC